MVSEGRATWNEKLWTLIWESIDVIGSIDKFIKNYLFVSSIVASILSHFHSLGYFFLASHHRETGKNCSSKSIACMPKTGFCPCLLGDEFLSSASPNVLTSFVFECRLDSILASYGIQIFWSGQMLSSTTATASV